MAVKPSDHTTVTDLPEHSTINGLSEQFIPLARPDIGKAELAAVQQVLASGHLSRGDFLARFEEAAAEQLGVSHAVALSSGTAGLIVALQALGVGAGDEVITVSYTVPATINAIIAVGAIPVLVDVNEETRGMAPSALCAAITPRTRAVIPVHAFGQAADLNAIGAICQEADVSLLEDACEALGNHRQGRPLGQWGEAGVFGFYPNKQITTGEGGLLVTNNAKLAKQARRLRNNGRDMDDKGMDNAGGNRKSGEWLDQVLFGWNFRLDEMSAALGYEQLQRLDELLTARRRISGWYEAFLREYLPAVRLPSFSAEENGNAWFSYVVHLPLEKSIHFDESDFDRLSQRTRQVVRKMKEQGIQCGRYFAPLHRQPVFERVYGVRQLPITDKLAATGLALPFYTALTKQQVESVVLSLRKALLPK